MDQVKGAAAARDRGLVELDVGPPVIATRNSFAAPIHVDVRKTTCVVRADPELVTSYGAHLGLSWNTPP
jgi:hypothetical protein